MQVYRSPSRCHKETRIHLELTCMSISENYLVQIRGPLTSKAENKTQNAHTIIHPYCLMLTMSQPQNNDYSHSSMGRWREETSHNTQWYQRLTTLWHVSHWLPCFMLLMKNQKSSYQKKGNGLSFRTTTCNQAKNPGSNTTIVITTTGPY